MTTEFSAALDRAVASGLVREDDAHLIRKWHRDGHVLAPDGRCAEMAREILDAAGVEAKIELMALARGGELPDSTRDSTRKTVPSGSLISGAARSRIAADWAARDPERAVRLLRKHPVGVRDLIAPDAAQDHGSRIADLLAAAAPDAAGRLLDLVARLPSTVEVEGEPVSVLAAARTQWGKWDGAEAVLPATTSGAPRIRVVESPEDRRLNLPVEPGPIDGDGGQLRLWTPPVKKGVAFLPLLLFDRAGGASMDRRSREVAERLTIEALLWSSPAIRNGEDGVVEPTVAEVCTALWPRSNFSKRQKMTKLRRALGLLDRLALVHRGGAWRPVVPRWIPPVDLSDLTEPLPLWIGLPPGSNRGPWIHRPTLRRLTGLEWRAHLGLAALRDHFGSDGGRRPWVKLGRRVPFPELTPVDRRQLVYGPDDVITRQARHMRQERTDAILKSGDDRIEMTRSQRDPRLWRPRWKR